MEVREDRVERLTTAAQRSSAIRDLEADLRRDLEVELVPFAREDVGLPDGAIRSEGTGRAGRFDGIFGGVIIEFKRPGLLDIGGERANAAQQGLGYLEDETLDARAVVITDGTSVGFLRADRGVAEVGEQTTLPFVGPDTELIPPIARFVWRPFDEASARAPGADRLPEGCASQR